jgi:hypothetical protein
MWWHVPYFDDPTSGTDYSLLISVNILQLIAIGDVVCAASLTVLHIAKILVHLKWA